MSKNEKENKVTPRRGHGPGKGGFEKPKNFKNAISRLLKELNAFKVSVILGLLFAAIGSIISINAPKYLSKLTDVIIAGLKINSDNLKLITTNMMNSFSEDNLIKLLDDKNLSLEDRKSISEFINSGDVSKLSINVVSKVFNDFEVDGVVINRKDQIKSVSTLMSLKDIKDANKIYSTLDKLPDSMKKVIEPSINLAKIKSIGIFLFVLYFISALFTYGEAILMVNVSNNFARKLRTKTSEKINRLPLKYFDNHAFGDLLSRVTNDIDTIASTLNDSLSTLVSAITLFLGATFMMFYTNWIMAVTAIVSSLFGFIFMFMILGKSQKYFMRRQVELGNLNGHIEEVYSGLNVVKAYNGQSDVKGKFNDYNSRVYDANLKSQFLSGLMHPMMGFMGNLGYVSVCIVGAILTMKGYITFGVIVAFITYVRLFSSPLTQIAQAMSSLQSTAAASERVFEIFDEEELADESMIKNKLKLEDVKGKIEFKNVNFTYDGNEKPTIKGFSAVANPGEKVAIVGPTGAGKTTLVNLLMKFYDIDSGDILIDGVSIHDLTRENIHDLFTMVLQDTWLFEGTIKDNIVYNRKNINDNQVKEVCKTVGVNHFIKTLPEGYDSIISDNDSVSAGQRQLLTIARGMIKNAPFLILDEATSNVDTRTEELVQKAMDELTKGKTSFIIAHRLSTIKNANLILVMDHGNIIEQGTHEELLQKNGFYAKLYNSQFSGIDK